MTEIGNEAYSKVGIRDVNTDKQMQGNTYK